MKTTKFSTSFANWVAAGVEGSMDRPDSIRNRKLAGIVGDRSARGWIDCETTEEVQMMKRDNSGGTRA